MVTLNVWVGLKLNVDSAGLIGLTTNMPYEIGRAIKEDGYYVTKNGLKLQYFQSRGCIVGFGMAIIEHNQIDGPKRFSQSVFGSAEAVGHRLDRLLWDWGLRRGTKGYRSEVWYQTDQVQTTDSTPDSDLLAKSNSSSGELLN